MNQDPRVNRTRDAVLKATAAILLEVGCEQLTIEAVAERSGVARSTIYRNWGERSALLIEAIEQLADLPDPPDSGCLADDLASLGARLAEHLTSEPFGDLLPSLVSAGSADPGLQQRLRAMADRRFAMVKTVFERGVLRGEIPAADLDARVEHFIAPFFTRHLLHGWPLDETFRTRQVRAALATVEV
ncbi:MAG: AcrR family transcriptional regulator [Candidatus Poriferisodalaceae bacterium]